VIDLCIAVTERLRAQMGSSLAVVGMAAEFAALESMPRQSPALYLLPGGEQAQPTEMLTRSTQRHACTFDVLLLLRNAGDPSGMRSAEALQTLRTGIQSALVNWTPGADCGAIQFAAGELADLIDNTTIWRDQFSFDRWVVRN